MTEREKLEDMVRETLRLAEQLNEGIVVYLLQNALMELQRSEYGHDRWR